jgi:uncharacterized protein (TIGR03083 family)
MDMGDIALRELGAIQDTVNGFGGSEWTTPTALRGWTVEDLLRHVAEVATLQGEAYQRARLDVSEQPSSAPVMVPTERLAAALAIASSFLANAVQGIDRAGDPPVPMPFAVVPASTADFLLLFEYGFHRFDLEHALNGSAHLSPDVVDTITALLGLTLPAIAAPNSRPPCAHITIEPDNWPATCFSWQDGAWTTTDQPGTDTWTVRGSAEAIARFAFGRPTPDAELAVDSGEMATAFKTIFPGP